MSCINVLSISGWLKIYKKKISHFLHTASGTQSGMQFSLQRQLFELSSKTELPWFACWGFSEVFGLVADGYEDTWGVSNILSTALFTFKGSGSGRRRKSYSDRSKWIAEVWKGLVKEKDSDAWCLLDLDIYLTAWLVSWGFLIVKTNTWTSFLWL